MKRDENILAYMHTKNFALRLRHEREAGFYTVEGRMLGGKARFKIECRGIFETAIKQFIQRGIDELRLSRWEAGGREPA